jgi:hypothetical protein
VGFFWQASDRIQHVPKIQALFRHESRKPLASPQPDEMFMESVSLADIQELVRHLPEEKLPHAYRLLLDLAQKQVPPSIQREFLRLPVQERRRLLTQQAAEFAGQCEPMAAECQNWQSGDFQDEV